MREGMIEMNVSQEADAEFMRLLKKEHPKRYRNLIHNMMQTAARNGLGNPADSRDLCNNPRCSKGENRQASNLVRFRAGTRFCSEGCKSRLREPQTTK